MSHLKRCIGILTSGGDCPGLNAVIRAVVKTAVRLDYDCVGFLRGYEGLVEPVTSMPLNRRNTAGILTQGGTILGSTNKGRFSATVGEDQRVSIDPALLEQVATTVRQLNICGLVCVGGDGSLAIAQQFQEHGIPVVGVPKTIDNDLGATTFTFGFDQRGGNPTTFDRVLATQFAAHAVRLIHHGRFGEMVCCRPPNIESVPIADAIGGLSWVEPDNSAVQAARALGISFGDCADLVSPFALQPPEHAVSV